MRARICDKPSWMFQVCVVDEVGINSLKKYFGRKGAVRSYDCSPKYYRYILAEGIFAVDLNFVWFGCHVFVRG
jgi:hypothetical protein